MGLKSFFRSLFNIRPKVYRETPLEEEVIKKERLIKEMARKIQSQDAQLSKENAKKKLKKEEVLELEKENEKIIDLMQQKYELDNERFKGTISLSKVIGYLQNKKYKGKIEITDKDDKIKFGVLKDFVILPDSSFGIKDSEDRLLSYGKTLRQVIHKPESLGNQIRRKTIKLPCNEHYQFVPDVEEIELPECTYDDKTGKIKWAKVNEKPFKIMIQEREEALADNHKYIEKIEQDKVDLVKQLRDLQRALRVQENIAENSQTELSKAMDKSIQFEQKIGGLQMRVVQLQELKNINDKLIYGLRDINDALLEKSEEIGSKTAFARIQKMIQDNLEWAKLNMGDTIINKQEEASETAPQQQQIR